MPRGHPHAPVGRLHLGEPLRGFCCGLPAVAVAEGGVVDNVIPDETGCLTEASPEAVAEGIARVLANPQRARRMGAAGRALVDDRYTWDRGTVDLLNAIRAAQ